MTDKPTAPNDPTAMPPTERLLLRYAINADHALDLLRQWARDADVEVPTVACVGGGEDEVADGDRRAELRYVAAQSRLEEARSRSPHRR
jgi:hypothetical protein